MTDPATDPATDRSPVREEGTGPPRLTLTVDSVHEQYATGRADHGTYGGPEVHVLVKVRADGLGAVPRHPGERSEVIVIDCSGSMGHPSIRKIAAARKAAAAAVEMLPDGTHFALVAGTDTAQVVYPWGEPDAPATVAASDASRADGSRTARTLDAHGGTRISAWLELTRRLLTARPGAAFRHALLLTDGQDKHGDAEELRRVLDECAGEFTCDALGIGEDWDAAQLRRIADRLHGRAEAVVTDDGAGDGGVEGLESQLTELFRELVGASTRRALPHLAVRVRPEPHLTVTSFKQLTPTAVDLTDTGVHDGDRTSFPTGAWGEETRWYRLGLRVDPDHPGHREEGTARIASLWLETEHTGEGGESGEAGGTEGAGAVVLPPETPVMVRWTGEPRPLTHIGDAARHFQRYAEFEDACHAGFAALDRGDTPTAERELGEAVRLAHALDDTDQLGRLGKLVTIENAAAGRVRLRTAVEPQHILSLALMSGHTKPPPDRPGGTGPDSGGPAVQCRRCDGLVRPGKFCENCGSPLRREP